MGTHSIGHSAVWKPEWTPVMDREKGKWERRTTRYPHVRSIWGYMGAILLYLRK